MREDEIYCIIIPCNKYGFVRKTDMITLIYDMHARLPGIPETVCTRDFACVCVCVSILVSLRGAEAEGQRDIHKYRERE